MDPPSPGRLISQSSHDTRDIRTAETGARKQGLNDGTDEAFSNFYTPKNDFFYSRSPYKPLHVDRRQIRLLKVFSPKPYSDHLEATPEWNKINEGAEKSNNFVESIVAQNLLENGVSGTNDSIVACELVDCVALSRINGNYCTLSYCAGAPTDTALVLVNGIPFNAFANLEHGIRHALDFWTTRNPNKELYLWVDQICINQRDVAERSNQVQLMRDIYRRSKETIVCLSTPAAYNHLAWIPESIRTFNLDGRRGTGSSVSEFKSFIEERYGGKNPIRPDDTWLDHLEAFIFAPWWTRSWVYQEFILSPRVCFLSGPDVVLWEDFHPLVDFIAHDFAKVMEQLLSTIAQVAEDEQLKARAQVEKEARDRELVAQELQAEHDARLRDYNDNRERYEGYKVQMEKFYEFVTRILNQGEAPSTLTGSVRRLVASTSIRDAHREKAEHYQAKVSFHQKKIDLYKARVREYRNMVDKHRKVVLVETQTLAGKGHVRSAEGNLADSERMLQEAEEAVERATQDAEFHEAEAKLRNVEAELFEVEAEFQKDRAYHDFIRKSLPGLTAAVIGRPDSVECLAMRKNERDWIFKVVCWCRHCCLWNQPYDFVTDGQEHWTSAQWNCRCDSIAGCAPTQNWIKERLSSPTDDAFPEQTASPDIMPLPTYDEVKAQGERDSLQENITALQKRIRRLDFSVISSTVKSKYGAGRQKDLKVALQHSRLCKASDPRDRVYAFLGLAVKDYAIIPDYRKENSIEKLLVHTAHQIIVHEGSLDILQHTSHGRQALGCHLPSWVPDWTSSMDESTRSFMHYCDLRVTDQSAKQFSAARDIAIEPEFRREGTNDTNIDLRVKGTFLDILDELSADKETSLQRFRTSNGKQVVATSHVLLDDEVWVLHGASKPVVLRPEGNDTYSFLCEALVLEEDDTISDVMFGSLFATPGELPTSLRDIWLL